MANADKHRISGRKAEINGSETMQFWNNRANKYDRDNPYVSVNLGDRNPARARQWDEYEKKHVLPLLNITRNDLVLDIGCGVGRLAEEVIPQCNFYLGTDYAAELLELAKQRISNPKASYAFVHAALQDIHENNSNIPLDRGKYTVALIDGIFQYINDRDIRLGLCNILTVMAGSCRIFITNTVGISERLTLDRFYSEELEADYSIIYRTEGEYMELFGCLSENGFQLSKSSDFKIETANNSETKRVFHIFSRG